MLEPNDLAHRGDTMLEPNDLIPLDPDAPVFGIDEPDQGGAPPAGGGPPGETDHLPQGAPQGGGGGANPAAAVGAIMQGAAMMVGAIAGAAAGAVDQQARPDIMAKRHVTRMGDALRGLWRIQNERDRMQERFDQAVAWLNDDSNRVQWMTGTFAMNAARKGKVKCPPLYPTPVGRAKMIKGDSPGGHAIGNPGCMCKTAKCAFRGRVKVDYDIMRGQASDAAGWLISIDSDRAGNVEVPDTPNTGNINQFRSEAKRSWSLLMSLEGFRAILLAAGITALWRSAELLDPNTLKLLFPDDPDGRKGKVPAAMGRNLIDMGLTLYGMGMVPGGFTLPLWSYGYSEQESNAIGIGPNIGQVAAVQARMYGTGQAGAVFSGYARYGAAPVGGLRGIIRSMIDSGEIRQVPEAPPSAVPGANIEAFQTQAAAEQKRFRREKRNKVLKTAGLVTGGVATTGLLVWGLFKVLSPPQPPRY